MSLNLDATLGAMHIGTSLAGYLLGLTTAQAVYYYTQYPDDSLIFKLLVGWTVTLDFFHQICIEHNGYEYQVTNWNNPAAILDIFWSLIAQVFVIGLLTVTAQLFYVWRLWKLSNSYILPAIVSMLALAQFGLLLFYCKEILGLASLAEVGKVTYLQKTINALSGATDVLIALAMVWHLRSIRTGFEKTDSILGRLMIFCVNSGALTSITAIWVIISVSSS
ncbi:hypothetical protein PENSPDRAFT_402962 [Peniophora sp. CONT]|nr:hypothetical protein PENSPDRAFT_402962 [Peniophora sp. CONT]